MISKLLKINKGIQFNLRADVRIAENAITIIAKKK